MTTLHPDTFPIPNHNRFARQIEVVELNITGLLGAKTSINKQRQQCLAAQPQALVRLVAHCV
jgi:hypothetical protein